MSAPNSSIDIATVDGSAFRRHVGSVYTLHHPAAGELEAELESVKDHPAHPRADGSAPARQPFSLVFKCALPADISHFEQGVFPLEHPEAGSCELFLVPIDGGEGTIYLEAVVT